MSARVEPTTLDVARNVARLMDGSEGTPDELRRRVANSLAYTTSGTVRPSRVTRRDVGLMMAAAGADSLTIRNHARAIAAMMRADLAQHSWSGSL